MPTGGSQTSSKPPKPKKKLQKSLLTFLDKKPREPVEAEASQVPKPASRGPNEASGEEGGEGVHWEDVRLPDEDAEERDVEVVQVPPPPPDTDAEPGEEGAPRGPAKDIATLINSGWENGMGNDEKLAILTKAWMPKPTYDFPCIPLGPKEPRRAFQWAWLAKHKWLAYSEVEGGGYCTVCAAFSNKNQKVGHNGSNSAGGLVAKPFKTFKRPENLTAHAKKEYHRFAQRKAEELIAVADGKAGVDKLIHNHCQKDREEYLSMIISAIVFLGRHEMSLRGDDTGSYRGQERLSRSYGKFTGLLHYMGQVKSNSHIHD